MIKKDNHLLYLFKLEHINIPYVVHTTQRVLVVWWELKVS